MSGNNQLSEIVATIHGSKTILLATHVFPDGDALGSLIGLGDILESMGKHVVYYAEEEVTYLYDFLPCCDKIVTSVSEVGQVDCVIALDCGDKLRLGAAMETLLSMHPVIVLDHHDGHKEFGDLRWVDFRMPSTGSIVYELAGALGVDISYKAAYCLYTAIVSDTGSFKYASTTADTFRVAGELVAKGVKPEEIAGKLFDNFTENRLHLLQLVLASLELFCDGELAVITASKEMFQESGAQPCDTETFINYPRSLAKVKIAAFFKENPDTVSVSLRSKGSAYDVAQAARQFGGGGHRNAAGFKVKGNPNIDQIKENLFAVLQPLIANP